MNKEEALSAKAYENTQRFMEVAAKSYANGKLRQTAMNLELSRIFGIPMEPEDYQITKTDGSGRIMVSVQGVPINVEIFALEVKNEIGTGHADPTMQAGLTVRKTCTLPQVSILVTICAYLLTVNRGLRFVTRHAVQFYFCLLQVPT